MDRSGRSLPTDVIERCVLLSSLPPKAHAQVLRQSRRAAFERGQTIFVQGQQAESMHVVLDGWVKLYRTAANGAEAVVSTMTRGSSIAVPVALRGGVYPVSAEAATDCELLSIPGGVVRQLLTETPETAVALVADVFLHLHELVQQVETLKARTGPERVAELLLEMLPDDAPAAMVLLPYDKSLIAARLGMSPESLSRAFARLRKLGVTVDRSRAHVSDVRRLRAYLSEEQVPLDRAAR